MNVTIIRSSEVFNNKIHQAILDCIDGTGKTIIITKDKQAEGLWRTAIVSHFVDLKKSNNVIDLPVIFRDFHFLHVMGTNYDEIQMLNYHGYKNLVLDNVWAVYHIGTVPTWITAIKTANPNINFIGVSDTWGTSYIERIDQRITGIKHVLLEDFKELYTTGGVKSKSPVKAIHVCEQDISKDPVIESGSYSPTGSSTLNKHFVQVDNFMEQMMAADKDEIKVYAKTPVVIDLLSQAVRSLSTIMTFSPTPTNGRKLTYITSQLNKLFMKMDVKAMDENKLAKNWQIDIRSQKSLIFCDWKNDEGLRRYINWYAKPDFTDGTLEYAINGFTKEGFSVMCVEGQRVNVSKELLKGCKNVFLFGTNKYDTNLIRRIFSNAEGDINVVMFVSKGTIDESNVQKAINGLKDSSLTVLKHDLSS
jgi:hypothetical protein